MHGLWAFCPKTLAPEVRMYKQENEKQPQIEDFYLPFGGYLSEDNRWVIMSKLIPWAEIEEEYSSNFSDKDQGAPAKASRMAFGALMIKEILQISDREVVNQIRETPYLQYFIGLEGYQDKEPFNSSMMVHFRKRFSSDTIGKINEAIIKKYKDEVKKKKIQRQGPKS